MKIVAISDLHGSLPKLPECDTVCICGDIIPLDIQNYYEQSIVWLSTIFNNWCNNLKCNQVIIIGGNHDFVFEKMQQKYSVSSIDVILWPFGKIIYLQDDACTINNIKFYGTPWCPELRDWAFYKSSKSLTDKFSQIPDCDILLTHTPPSGLAGTVLQKSAHNFKKDYGSSELSNIFYKKNIKLNLCGHIHSGCHFITKINNTDIVNVSIKDEFYKNTYSPYLFEI